MRKLMLIAAASLAGCAAVPASVASPSDVPPARPLQDAHNRLCEYALVVYLVEPMLARVPHAAEFLAAYHQECDLA